VIAFANSGGGRILVGIHDDGSAAGVTRRAALISRAVNSLQDGSGPDLTRFTDLAFEMMVGKSVLVIQVQRGTAMPYYLVGKGIRPESVFVRQGSTVSASRAVILKMIKETGGDQYENARSLNC